MRGLFQGGECNPNGMEASSNQFKTMMDAMMLGNQNPEKMMEFARQPGVNFEDEIRNRRAMFEQMKDVWAREDQQLRSQGANMDEVFKRRQMDQARMMEQIQQVEWARQQQMVMAQRAMMEEQFKHQQAQHALMMQRMDPVFQKEQERMKLLEGEFQKATIEAEAEMWKNEALMDEAFKQSEVSFEEQQMRIKAATSNMLNVMMEDEDPRFKNSQFLNFIKRVNEGDLLIKGQELIEVKPDLESKWSESERLTEITGAELENAFKKQKESVQSTEQMMENAFQRAKEQVGNDFQKMYEQQWQRRLQEYEAEYQNSAEFEKKLEEKYKDILKQMDLDLASAWQGASDLEEQMVYGDFRDKYIFSENNPYLDVALPLPLAMEFISKGKNNDAILALEAHLRKNENDSERWRVLGQILQENDQDQKSVPCFVNALRGDPKSLDSLLLLGVSCTNILDEVKAMNYLKHWMINNPKYAALKADPMIIPDEYVNEATYKVEDIKMMNMRMIDLFEAAMRMNQQDPELMTSLAVLYFIKRDYEISVGLFDRALKLDPTNYSLWNKMGAALAHLGRPDEAINCYHRALEIKPNYVRVWVNLGIAHGYKSLYDEAARFYLNALSFRPDAKHIWAYLQTTFMSMQRYDLIKLIAKQDPSVFTEFDVMRSDDLPMPQIDYRLTTEKHLIHNEANSWVKEIMK